MRLVVSIEGGLELYVYQGADWKITNEYNYALALV